mmetsp:Transcript_11776/g.25899  ORF Transcript_11776/g.25899 Transcript_11776/m.25899 type:complete len:215 (-) Transcript_11776:1477-2121(-)
MDTPVFWRESDQLPCSAGGGSHSCSSLWGTSRNPERSASTSCFFGGPRAEGRRGLLRSSSRCASGRWSRTGGCGQIPPFEDRTHLHCSREASSTFRRHGWKSLLNLLSEAFHEKARHNRSRYCWCHRRERSELHRAASTPHAGHPDGHHENEGFGAVRGAILILFEVIHEGLPGGGSTLLTANEEPWDPKGRFAASESHQSGRCSGLAGVGVGS